MLCWYNTGIIGLASDRSMIKPLLDEMFVLGSTLLSFSIVFARREANQAAHCCAKYAYVQGVSNSWEVEPPAFLVHSLGADYTFMLMV